MKRIVLPICICGLAAAVAAPASFGFANIFDYVGSVKGQEATASVGFAISKSAAGRKRAVDFTVTGVDYSCSDAAPGQTEGWRFERGMRIKARKFSGEGDWTGLPLDPVGKVDGRLKPGGIASGSFKITGELAGPGTHCKTGFVGWKASTAPLTRDRAAG
ncbi:MAG: hypothetical protein U0R51_06185 [Solirubrobacterales bacterium]